MSAAPFPLAGGTAAGYNQSTFSPTPQIQLSLVLGHSDFAFFFAGEPLPVDTFIRETQADIAAFLEISSTEATIGGSCAIGYTSVEGWALISFCGNTTTPVGGSVIIARCQGEYGGEIVEPPVPPPPGGRCPEMAACDIIPDLTFKQEPNE